MNFIFLLFYLRKINTTFHIISIKMYEPKTDSHNLRRQMAVICFIVWKMSEASLQYLVAVPRFLLPALRNN